MAKRQLETMDENKLKEFEKALMMFVVLSGEAEKWAYAIKGMVKFDFKWRLNQYLDSAKILTRYINEHVNDDAVADDGEVFSILLNKVMSLREDENRLELMNMINDYKEPNTDEPRGVEEVSNMQ
jgi:hypothetical protein